MNTTKKEGGGGGVWVVCGVGTKNPASVKIPLDSGKKIKTYLDKKKNKVGRRERRKGRREERYSKHQGGSPKGLLVGSRHL